MRCVQWDEQRPRKVWHVEPARLGRRRQMIGFWIWLQSAVGDPDKSSFAGVVDARVWCEGPEGTEEDRKGEIAVFSESVASFISFFSIFMIKMLNKKSQGNNPRVYENFDPV